MQYIVLAEDSSDSLHVEKLNTILTVLESFGNVHTNIDNDARTITYTIIFEFGKTSQIASATVQIGTYEEYRVVHQPDGELPLHIFYQLLAAASSVGTLHDDLFLHHLPKDNRFLVQMKLLKAEKKLQKKFVSLCELLLDLGVLEPEAKTVWCVIAAIIHLSSTEAIISNDKQWKFTSPRNAELTAQLLGIHTECLTQILQEQVQQAKSVNDSLNRIMIGLYSELLSIFVTLIHRSISVTIHAAYSAGIFYFCHNYFAERIHLLFHHMCLISSKNKFSQKNTNQEAILKMNDKNNTVQSCTHEMQDSQDHLTHVGKSMPQTLWFLDNKAALFFLNDLLLDIIINCDDNKDCKQFIEHFQNDRETILNHFYIARQSDNSTPGVLERSQDNCAMQLVAAMLCQSNRQDVKDLFAEITRSHNSVIGTSSMTHNSLQVEFIVSCLCETLRKIKMKFAHSLKPYYPMLEGKIFPNLDFFLNIRSKLGVPKILNVNLLSNLGLSNSLILTEYKHGFKNFFDRCITSNNILLTSTRCRDILEMILEGIQVNSCRLEMNQVFLHTGILTYFEEQLNKRFAEFQVRFRGPLVTCLLAQYREQENSIRCIQKNVRKFLSMRNWSWWNLYVETIRLPDVNEESSTETEKLCIEIAKLEQEKARLLLIEDSNRLEAKHSKLMTAEADQSRAKMTTQTAKRVQFEQKLMEEGNHEQRWKKQIYPTEVSKSLEVDLMYPRIVRRNVLSKEELDDVAYKERYEQALKETEIAHRQMDKQHEQDLEQFIAIKKQLGRKLADAYKEVEEQRQAVVQWKKKAQKLINEASDLRILLEKQDALINLLEEKQRKFHSEFNLVTDELHHERAMREKTCNEKELILGEKYNLEQDFNHLKLAFESKERQLANITQELEEMTFGETTEGVTRLQKAKHQLEMKLKDHEEELNDLRGQVHMLEQTKFRLEVDKEQMCKQYKKEMLHKDEELEELRNNNTKKVKALELELENEHEKQTMLLKGKHDLEKRFNDTEEKLYGSLNASIETNRTLKRDLKRAKVLIRNAQLRVEQCKEESYNKTALRQLRNQLEDAESAYAVAVKGRQAAEMETSEGAAYLEEAARIRIDLEDRLAAASRKCTQLQSQLEENEEEMAELLKKYRNSVNQLTGEQTKEQEYLSNIFQLEAENHSLRDHVSELTSRLENIETTNNPETTLVVKTLQIKNKSFESKLELEHAVRSRLEIQVTRLKESAETLQRDISDSRNREKAAQEYIRKISKSLRETKEDYHLLMSKDAEHSSKCQYLEKHLAASKVEVATLKQNLKSAIERIEDLETALEGDLVTNADGSDSDNTSAGLDDF